MLAPHQAPGRLAPSLLSAPLRSPYSRCMNALGHAVPPTRHCPPRPTGAPSPHLSQMPYLLYLPISCPPARLNL